MHINIHVETAGTLPKLIPECDKYEITELTVAGNLDDSDMGFIKEMAKKCYFDRRYPFRSLYP